MFTYLCEDSCAMWANIGKFCSISRKVDIGGNAHNYNHTSTFPEYMFKRMLGENGSVHPDEEYIKIGNDVWIGQGVSILRKKGLIIGDGAVIGSGAVITKSVPPYAIVGGVPGKIIKYRFSEDVITELLRIKWWDWSLQTIKKNWDVICDDLDLKNFKKLQKVEGSMNIFVTSIL